MRIDATPIQIHKCAKNYCNSVIVLVLRQFLPILTLLFKHSKKSYGVRKFLLEKLSYIFVYAIDYGLIDNLNGNLSKDLGFLFVLLKLN